MGKTFIMLGIESSCDETAAAIVRDDGTVMASQIASQMDIHASHGGVVPEIAARAHLDSIDIVIAGALRDAGIGMDDIDGVAATGGPGLIGGVVVGTVTAKAIASARNLPYFAVNHLEGHALSARLVDKVAFPYLLLLVSGGHTQLLAVHGPGAYERYGTTMDDAAGEAFDKSAKIMGLGYPGGPAVEMLAAQGDARAIALPSAASARWPALPRRMARRHWSLPAVLLPTGLSLRACQMRLLLPVFPSACRQPGCAPIMPR